MNITIKRAVIYCRVSTKEQVEEGNSLSTQEKVCTEYALKNGFEIGHTFIEEGESAKTQDRTELRKMLEFCTNRKNAISAVIAYKLDRISRNTDDYSQIRILLKTHGVEIKSTSEFFENTPAGRFMENIIANVAQFDNDVRTERSVGGMKDAMRDGRYVWTAPLGYSNVRNCGKSTIALNEKALLVLKAFELVAQNLEPTESIRRYMMKEGFKSNKDRIISRAQFYRLLRNETYAGWIIKFGERHKGFFEPLVSEELFQRVQWVLKRRKNCTKQYQVEHPDFPLRRFVRHSSGSKLTGCWSQGQRQKYPYYRFLNPNMTFAKDLLETKFIRFLNLYTIHASLCDKLKKAVEINLVKAGRDNQKEKMQLQKYLEDLEKKQDGLIDKNNKGIISDQTLKQQLERIENETAKIQGAFAAIQSKRTDLGRLFDLVSMYLKKPGDIWMKAKFPEKKRLQGFEFPQGVLFDGEKFRTTEVCKLFKVKPDFFDHKSHGVPLTHSTSNTPEITNTMYWDEIGKEIITLSEIIRDIESKT